MADQEYSESKRHQDHDHEQDSDLAGLQEDSQAGQTSDELANELDQLLDEIDSVLETNAEEFVKSYVQKGGQ